MVDGSTGEPVFRSNKRRKVFRKRADSDAEPIAPRLIDEASKITDQCPAGDELESFGTLQVHKKPGVRRHGIGFSSTAPIRSSEVEQYEERALVLANEEATQDTVQNDRFVKPTGKVDVTEDKHMTAYIDSKMAEMRSSAAPPNNVPSASSFLEETKDEATYSESMAPNHAVQLSSSQRTIQQAQARSSRVYQRPTKRRAPPARDPTDVARDSMIDQLMNEAQVPIYDRSAIKAGLSDGGSGDNDAAAAEAFKAQLLADLEQNRRKPSSRAKEGTATGPKLGGSRAQRERMRAMEEANKSGPAKK